MPAELKANISLLHQWFFSTLRLSLLLGLNVVLRSESLVAETSDTSPSQASPPIDSETRLCAKVIPGTNNNSGTDSNSDTDSNIGASSPVLENTDQGLTVRLYPRCIPLGPEGGSTEIQAVVYRQGEPYSAISTIVFSRSNSDLSVNTAVDTDLRGRVLVDVSVSQGSGLGDRKSEQELPDTMCLSQQELANNSCSVFILARPQIKRFSPTTFIWTGTSRHTMTLYGLNFSKHVAVLVAGNEADIKLASSNVIKIEFDDPKSIGDAALTYVTVINLSTAYMDRKNGISFVQ